MPGSSTARRHRVGVSQRRPSAGFPRAVAGRRALAALLAVATGLVPATTAQASESTSTGRTGAIGPDQSVTVEAGDGTALHGSLRLPEDPDRPGPAALLIPGSGPTDRDGNQPGLEPNTLLSVADTLSDSGVATLRYDKVGSGETGVDPELDPASVEFDLFVDHAADALRFLADQPGVDPDRLMVVGHSEGSLIALVLANREDGGAPAVSSLALLAPASLPYFTTLQVQLREQIPLWPERGLIPESRVEPLLNAVDPTVEAVRETGEIPAWMPAEFYYLGIFHPSSLRFLVTADRHDPRELAGEVTSDVPVLLACAGSDIQIPCSMVDEVRDALDHRPAGVLRYTRVPQVNHVLKEVGHHGSDGSEYGDPLPFSRRLRAELSVFSLRHLWLG
ncbi:alpha/beta hydrolase family protein [Actinoalloteichus spitiensis]|uniref:alpha/beta hydrolase family protein n=1 Tax=Actinoalloteichus spitiensis TaxID=252394 RepID=UPI000372EF92|nr:alpha/beta hydrolase [Actinoalloteichus spitiensis]